jgi:hypothetical protein
MGFGSQWARDQSRYGARHRWQRDDRGGYYSVYG